MNREAYYQLILEQITYQDFKNIAVSFPYEEIHYRNFFNYFAREFIPSNEELDSLIDETDDEDIKLHYKELKLSAYFMALRDKFPKLMKSTMKMQYADKRKLAQEEFVEDELFLKTYYFAKEILEDAPDSYLAGVYLARLVNYVGRVNKAFEILESIKTSYFGNETINEGLRKKRIEIHFYNKDKKGYMNEVSHITPFMCRAFLRFSYFSMMGYLGMVVLYFIGGITMFFKMGENSLFIIFGIMLIYFWQFPLWYRRTGNYLLLQGLWMRMVIHIVFTAGAYAIYLLLIQ